ncbi:MAG: phosphatase PAP2 family protein [Minisyncoccia bacterium]
MTWDTALFNWIHGLSGWSVFTDAMGVFFAQYLAYLLVVAALFFIFRESGTKARLKIFFNLALATLISRGILTEIMDYIYARPRPFSLFGFSPLVNASGASFPSGHAALFFGLGFMIFSLNRRWGYWFLSLAFVNGLARIFAGVHYPLDILGGILFGFAGAYIAEKLIGKPAEIDENQSELSETGGPEEAPGKSVPNSS